MSDYYKLLRCNEHLNAQIDTLINVFTKYYGESKREEIENKFRNALFIGYMTPSQTRMIIYDLEKEKTNQLFEEELSKVSLHLTLNDLTNNTSFRNNNIQPISNYYEFYRLFRLGKEGRKKEYLSDAFNTLKEYIPGLTIEEFQEMVTTGQILEKYKDVKPWIYNNIAYFIDLDNCERQYKRAFNKAKELLHKIDKDITLDNFQESLESSEIQALNVIATAYPKMLEEYNASLGPGTQIYRELEEYEKFKAKVNEKNYKEYLLENLDLIPQINREVVKNYILSGENNYQIDEYIRIFLPVSLDSEHPIEIFSKEQDEILKSSEESDWKKDRIKKRRIKYFNTVGIKLGDDYASYEESDVVKRYTPSYEEVERSKQIQQAKQNKRNIELFEQDPKVKPIREKITSLELLDKEDSFNAKIYNDSYTGTFINPNVQRTKNGYRIYPLLVMRFSKSDYLDHDLIHELNHIFELSLESADEEQYTTYCGWEKISEQLAGKEKKEIDTTDVSREIRDYELLNEIINELIAQDIGNMMHQSGIYIFNSKEKASMKNATSYEHTFFLVKEFFETFKDKILESRRNGNIHIIWNAVGKENFDSLNSLFKVFQDNFSGFKIYNLLDDLREKRETERTKVYYEIIERRDEILRKMNAHSMLRESEITKTEEVKVNS